MRKIENYDSVKENQGGEYEKLPAGGYVCKITASKDVTEKEYLELELDIAEGPYQGWFSELYQRAKFWGGKLIRSYKETAAGFFKGFTTAVEESNAKYKWNWNESTLVSKFIGIVFGYEEYMSNSGEVKERIYVAQTRSVDAIRKGDFKVPELKKLENKKAPSYAAPAARYEAITEDDGLPF